MGSGHFARSASKAFVLALALGFFLFSCHRDSLINRDRAGSAEHEKGPHLLEALQRERYLMSRHGFQFRVPKQAIPRAVSKMRAMERTMAARRGGTSNAAARGTGGSSAAAPALAGTWGFLGPQPITEKANFTGSAIGGSMPMTGRLTSVAAEQLH